MSINNLISHRPSVCLSEQKDSDPINTEKVKKDSKKDQHIFIISFSGILHMELFSHRSILTLNYWKHIKMLIFTTFLEMTISGIIQTAGMFEEVRIDKRLFSFDLISSDMTKIVILHDMLQNIPTYILLIDFFEDIEVRGT